MIKRRSFLQALGLAPFAFPKAVEQVVQQQALGMAGMSIIGSSGVNVGFPLPRSADPHTRLTELLTEFAKMQALGRPVAIAKARREYSSTSGVNHLDPDLVSNRSFSLSAKVRIQREREIERRADQPMRWLQNEIADIKERFGL